MMSLTRSPAASEISNGVRDKTTAGAATAATVTAISTSADSSASGAAAANLIRHECN